MSEMTTGAPDLPTAVEQLRRRVNGLQRQIEEIRGPRGLRLPAWLKGYLGIGLAVLTWGASQIYGLNRELGEVRTQLVALDTRFGAVESRLGAVETRLGAVETRLASFEARVGDSLARIEARLPAGATTRK